MQLIQIYTELERSSAKSIILGGLAQLNLCRCTRTDPTLAARNKHSAPFQQSTNQPTIQVEMHKHKLKHCGRNNCCEFNLVFYLEFGLPLDGLGVCVVHSYGWATPVLCKYNITLAYFSITVKITILHLKTLDPQLISD